MVRKRISAVLACATFVVLGTSALANEYRPGEFLNLDLPQAVLSPKRLGPPNEFAKVPVQARTEPRQVMAEPGTVPTKPHALLTRATKPPGDGRARLAHRQGNPLDAQAMDTRIQTWPCTSGGICNWKR